MTVVSLFCVAEKGAEEGRMLLDLIFLEMCQVRFPDFSDLGTPIQTPGIITFPLAMKKGADILKHQYAVDPKYTTLIGQRERT